MTKKILFLPFLFFVSTSYAQIISGKIVDSLKHEPVAFANIVLADGIHGTTSDIEGNFKLSLPAGYQQAITISHVSYQKVKLPLSFFKLHQLIKLKPSEMVLSEVVVKAGENPAFRIIRNAVRNKSRNDPDNLTSYQYHSYNKFIIKPTEMSEGYKKRVDSLRNNAGNKNEKQKELLEWDSISSQIGRAHV